MPHSTVVNVRWHMPNHTRDAFLRPQALTKPARVYGEAGPFFLETQLREDLTQPATILRITHRPSGDDLTISGNLPRSRSLVRDVAEDLIGVVPAACIPHPDGSTRDPQSVLDALTALWAYLTAGPLVSTRPRVAVIEVLTAHTGMTRAQFAAWLEHPFWARIVTRQPLGSIMGLLAAEGLDPAAAANFLTAFHDVRAVLTPATSASYEQVDDEVARHIAHALRAGWGGGDVAALMAALPDVGPALPFIGIEGFRPDAVDSRWFTLPPEQAALAAACGLTLAEALSQHESGTLSEGMLRVMAGLTQHQQVMDALRAVTRTV